VTGANNFYYLFTTLITMTRKQIWLLKHHTTEGEVLVFQVRNIWFSSHFCGLCLKSLI